MKILMVLTSHDQLGKPGRKTGFWLEELRPPFVFQGRRRTADLASPGGQPPIDRKAIYRKTPAMARFKTGQAAQGRFPPDAQAPT
jgi:hypothetical protein